MKKTIFYGILILSLLSFVGCSDKEAETAPEIVSEIVIGDIFINKIRHWDDPFVEKRWNADTSEIIIIDIQNKYVEYKTFPVNRHSSANSCSIKIFLRLYKKK